jgi:hypothetical protein
MITQINNANVKLHAPFTGLNNATTAKDYSRSAHTLSFGGGAKISTTQSYYNGGSSLYVDGAGDWVDIASNPLSGISSDFTVKFKFYTASSSRQYLIGSGTTNATHYLFGLDYSSVGTNKLGLWVSSTGSSWNIINADGGGNGICPTTLPLNVWNDIMVTRKGNIWSVYLNGSLEIAVSATGTIATVATTLNVGRTGYASGDYFYATGYFQDVMVVVGEAWNTHKFYDTTLDAKSAYLKAGWKFGDYGVNDCIGANTLTNSGTVTFATAGLQGYKTATFNGSSQYLTVDHSAIVLGTQFTLGGWFKADSTASPMGFLGQKVDANTYWDIYLFRDTNKLFLYHTNDGGTTLFYATVDLAISASTWYHWAWVRTGSTMAFYLNGVAQTIAYNTGAWNTTFEDLNASWTIGRTEIEGLYFDGEMQEILYYDTGLTATEIALLYNSGKAKLLTLERREHKQYFSENTAWTANSSTLDALTPYVKLALACDGANNGTIFVDDSTSAHPVVVTTPAQFYTATDQKKAGASSCYMYGAGSYHGACASHADFAIGTGNFTLKFDIRFVNNNANFALFDIKGYADGLSVRTNESGSNKFDVYIASGSALSWNWTRNANQWYQCILTRVGSTVTLYVDGSSLGDNTSSGSITQGIFQIGESLTGATSDRPDIWLDEIILLKGRGVSSTEATAWYNSNTGSFWKLPNYLNSYSKYLVANWKLDEMSGTRYDSAGFNQLADTGGVTYTADATFGRVATFNGSSQYLSIAGTNVALGAGDFAVSWWFKADALTDNSGLVGNRPNTGSSTTVWLAYIYQNKIRVDNEVALISQGTTTLSTGVWYHAVWTRIGTALKLYLNTNEEDSDTNSVNYNAVADLKVGKADASGAYGWFDGQICNVSLFIGAGLDATAVAQLYNAGAGRKPAYDYLRNGIYGGNHLIASWPMQETTGTRTDTRNGYELVQYSGGAVPGYTTGKTRANCMTFTGSERLVWETSSYDLAALQASGNWSMLWWFKTTATASQVMLDTYYSNKGVQIDINSTTAGRLRVGFYGGTAGDLYHDGSYNEGNWHRACVTASGTLVKLYVDGVLRTTGAFIPGDSGQHLFLGQYSGGGYNFVGQLQELSVLDTAVDEQFIAKDWNSGTGWFYRYSS